ncbi:MAG TPA: phenylalanine--tRNA ligase subunit beta [Bryobacteraceae bacterium]|nr:phenylalanine--tRNA ligase subunit beta [Bryobacteraceae bacterium]
MKFSYNWIREFVNDLDVPAQALERLITMKTAECEGIETAGALLAGAVPARIEAVEPIEGAHNVKAVVETARYGRKTVVCGAPNCRAGITTAYVPLGIKTISGVASDGMLASAAELEISRDHAGIIELAGNEELPAPDSIIEIDNKSITHRPDLWGHHGMAREVAAITGKPLRDPVDASLLPPPGGPVAVEIEDLHLCPRYSALVFENVTVQPSPLWLQQRLTAVGLNPINNIVDLTNYIMAELAQPMHAFDRAKLHGDTIHARPARAGERIEALNGEHYDLSPSNLVIADASGPIAIAGVIGGQLSAISESTTSIVLESANFNAGSVRKTSAALKLRTDASMRFEKAQDPHNTVRALARALELLPLLSPGIRLVGSLADRHGELSSAPTVSLHLEWLARKLGRVLDPAEVRRILESLQFGVIPETDGAFTVTIPTWRATKDIAMPDDLVEEVGRMIGYDSIPPQPPLVPCAPSYDPPEREFLRGIKRTVAAQGFTEVSNYSFISEEEARRFGFAVEDHVRVLNPIAAGQELMRTSLLPGIYRNVVENAKHFDDFRLFETGHAIHRKADAKPEERPHLMAALYSRDGDGRAGLLEIKRLAECLAPGIHIRPSEARPWEHPARCAEIWWNGVAIGRFGELHPKLVETGRAAVLDIDLKLLQELRPERIQYAAVRRFPTSDFDLSIIAGARELAATLELEIRRFAGEYAVAIEYVREYQGPPLPEEKKSVSFRVVLGADRTLSSAEITEIRSRIIEGLQSMAYELRV